MGQYRELGDGGPSSLLLLKAALDSFHPKLYAHNAQVGG
jgi:hypothetical protein